MPQHRKNIVGVLIVVWIFTLAGCTGSSSGRDRYAEMSPPELEEVLRSELTPGVSTKSDVKEFLAQSEIYFSEQPDFGWTPAGLKDVDWIGAAIHQSSMFYRNKKLNIDFYFERKDQKLIKFEVSSSHTAL